MKKRILLLLSIMCICGLIGCEKDSVSEVTVDYGTSSIYSEDDMNEAIELVKDEFVTWEGCELQSISYSSDEECNSDNISWLNELAQANNMSDEFTQCMMLVSDFHTSENAPIQWNADTNYEDFQWWLARTDNGEWKLISWGYC